MNKLTIIILTNRADERFQAAVASALFADEVLVITFGSVKLSLSKLPNLKTIIGGPEISNFAEARNISLGEASHPWVLFLDSDEVLTPGSISEIKKITQQSSIAGAYVQRQDFFAGHRLQWGETGQAQFLRLAQKSKLHFERSVHEIGVVDGPVVSTKITLLHYPHPTLSEFWNSIVHYSRMEAELRAHKGQAFSLFQMLFYPPAKFVTNYFFKLGFLDGWSGLVYAVMMSLHSLLVRVFWYEKTRK